MARHFAILLGLTASVFIPASENFGTADAAQRLRSVDEAGYPGLSSPLIVRNDSGGFVVKYAMQMGQLARSGRKVRITGRCDSSCTMYLGLNRRQVCVGPNAYFRFHRPSAPSAKTRQAATQILHSAYPGWVRSWIRQKGGLTDRLVTMDYAYASRFLPTCEA